MNVMLTQNSEEDLLAKTNVLCKRNSDKLMFNRTIIDLSP